MTGLAATAPAAVHAQTGGLAPERSSVTERLQGLPGVRNIPGLNGQPFTIPGLGGAVEEEEKPEPPAEPSAEALWDIAGALHDSRALAALGLGWLKDGRFVDAAEAFTSLGLMHPEMAALSLYNRGCVSYGAGDHALAEQFYERALAEPNAARIHRLATFNLGAIRLDRVANRRDEVLPGLDPIRNALQAGPEQAWASYEEAVSRSIEDLTIASAMFRAALLADPEDEAAMDNLRYARGKIIEMRHEREAKRVEFEEFLNEVITPQEALERVMDLSQRQLDLAEETAAAKRLRGEERETRVGEIVNNQKRVTAETEDLLRRLDAMARRSEELFGEENPLFAQLYDQLLNTGADAIADAVGAQRWADFELRGDELEAAQDLQMQAHEDLRSILEDFAAQAESLEDLMEMFADQMQEQIERAEQQFEGEPQDMEDLPGEIDPETAVQGDEFREAVLDKEREDTDRRDRVIRPRREEGVEKDW